jgi:parvulin-like peptidyl-prolyl isomerase
MRFVILGCIVAAGLLTPVRGAAAQPELINGISAIVDASVITMEDLEALNTQIEGELAREYRGRPELYRQKLAEARSENLKQLIDRKLVLHDFKTSYNIPDAVIDKDVDRMIDSEIRSSFRDRRTLIKTLQAQGTTYERYRQLKRERFLVDELRRANVSREVIISPYKIETYYQTNLERFKVPDQIRVRTIVLTRAAADPEANRKLAEEILGKIKDGTSFAEMATVYSQGSQREQGGDWGWVDKSVLRKELVAAAETLKPGETSGVIETADAFYLMKLEENRPTHYRPLKEVRDQIEQTLLLAEQNRLEQQWIQKVRQKTFIRVF